MTPLLLQCQLMAACGGEPFSPVSLETEPSGNDIRGTQSLDSYGNSSQRWINLTNGASCTGTVVDTHTLVTAAHCICRSGTTNSSCDGVRAKVQFEVYSEEHDVWTRHMTYGDAVVHPDWKPASLADEFDTSLDGVDIGVIQLDRPLGDSTPDGRWLASPLSPMFIPANDPTIRFMAVGYGQTDENCTNAMFEQRHQVDVYRRDWTANYCKPFPTHTHTMRPLNDDMGVCEGDSGGAIYGAADMDGSLYPNVLFAVIIRGGVGFSHMHVLPVFQHVDWLNSMCSGGICSYGQ